MYVHPYVIHVEIARNVSICRANYAHGFMTAKIEYSEYWMYTIAEQVTNLESVFDVACLTRGKQKNNIAILALPPHLREPPQLQCQYKNSSILQ